MNFLDFRKQIGINEMHFWCLVADLATTARPFPCQCLALRLACLNTAIFMSLLQRRFFVCGFFFFFLSTQRMKPSQVSNWRSIFRTSSNQLASVVMPLYCWHPLLHLLFFQCQGANGIRVPFAKSMPTAGVDSHQGLPSSSPGERANPCRIATLSISGSNTETLLYRYTVNTFP